MNPLPPDETLCPSVSHPSHANHHLATSSSAHVIAPLQLRRAFDMLDIKEIILREKRVGWADMFALGASLRSSLHMHTLNLWRTGLDARSIVALGRALPASCLKILSIEDNEFMYKDETMAPPLNESPPEVPVLLLPVESDTASLSLPLPAVAITQPPSTAPKSTPTPTKGGKISASTPVIVPVLSLPPPPPPPVLIRRIPPPLPKSHADAWATLAARTSPIETLSLRCNGLDTECMQALGTAVSLNHRLRAINLSLNPIGDDGIIAFAQGLSDSRSLRSLSIAHCGIGFKGVQALAQALVGSRLDIDQIKQRSEAEWNAATHITSSITSL